MEKYFYNKAVELCYENKISKAILYLDTSLKLGNESFEEYNLKGLCHYRLGEFRQALAIWNSSLKKFPNNNKAEVYIEELKKVTPLIEIYNSAIDEVEKGNLKKAVKLLKNIKNEIKDFANILAFFGLCNYQLGYKKQAVKLWRKSLVIDSTNELVIKYLVEADVESLDNSWNVFRFLVTFKK